MREEKKQGSPWSRGIGSVLGLGGGLYAGDMAGNELARWIMKHADQDELVRQMLKDQTPFGRQILRSKLRLGPLLTKAMPAKIGVTALGGIAGLIGGNILGGEIGGMMD